MKLRMLLFSFTVVVSVSATAREIRDVLDDCGTIRAVGVFSGGSLVVAPGTFEQREIALEGPVVSEAQFLVDRWVVVVADRKSKSRAFELKTIRRNVFEMPARKLAEAGGEIQYIKKTKCSGK